MGYLETYRILKKFQFGFQPKHGVETALLKINNDLLLCKDRGETVVLVALDTSAAFDCLDHNTLLNLMSSELGINGIELEWFRSYLSNRKQFVRIMGGLSNVRLIKNGVPQGSLLGPILFNLYLLPIVKVFRKFNVNFHVYADDVQFYFVVSDLKQAQQFLDTIMSGLVLWFTSAKLKLNKGKTQILVINSHLPCPNDFCVQNDTITCSDVVNNLGFIIDKDMKFECQIRESCKVCYFYMYLIGKKKSYLPFHVLRRAIECFVLSRLNYCCSLYYNLPHFLLKKLQMVQNAAARLLTGKRKYDHISDTIIQLKWLNIQNFILYRNLCLVYKCLCERMPLYLTESLQLQSGNYNLRSTESFNLVLPRTYTKYGDRAFENYCPKIWNDLPDYIKNSPMLCVILSVS